MSVLGTMEQIRELIDDRFQGSKKSFEALIEFFKQLDNACCDHVAPGMAFNFAREQITLHPEGHERKIDEVVNDKIQYCLALIDENSEWEELVLMSFMLKDLELIFQFGILENQRPNLVSALRNWSTEDGFRARELMNKYFDSDPLLNDYYEKCMVQASAFKV